MSDKNLYVVRNNNDPLFLEVRSKKIYAALNLVFFSEVIFLVSKSQLSNIFVLWPDGIVSKILVPGIKKFAGRKFLGNALKYCIENELAVTFIGSPVNDCDSYLDDLNYNAIAAPIASAQEIVESIDFTELGDVVVLNLPSPKQEMVAVMLYEHIPINILCTGGALNMLLGHEKPVHRIIEKYGLEFLWRLRTDFVRRVLRLLKGMLNLRRGYKECVRHFNVKIDI